MDNAEAIEEAVISMYPDEDSYPAPFTAFGEEQLQQYMPLYDSSYYGGTAIVLVTVDTDGHYSIADYYVAKGDATSTTERVWE